MFVCNGSGRHFGPLLGQQRSQLYMAIMGRVLKNIVKADKIKTLPFSGSTSNLEALKILKPSPSEEEGILQFLNSCTMKELGGVDLLTQEQVTDLLRHRNREGTFPSLDSFLTRLHMDDERLSLLFTKLLSLSTKKTNATILNKYFAPELTSQDVRNASSVTGLEVCLDCVCFSRVSADMQLQSWDHVSLPPGLDFKRQHLTQIFEMAHSLVEKIPESDIYIMERNEFTLQKLKGKSLLYHIFIAQLQMSILHLLNSDFKANGRHRVFFARRYFVKKTFDLIVGGEGVSGQHLLMDLEDNSVLPANLCISSELKHNFFKLPSDLQKERYTQALFLPLALLKLSK